MLTALWADARQGARVLRHAPGLSAVIVATLALSLSAAVAAFSVLNATILRPLPYREPGQVVSLSHIYAGSPTAFSPPTFLDFRREAKAFLGVVASVPWEVNLTGRGEPERVRGLLVSATFFETLGVSAEQGRTFRAEEEQPGREHVVVVSHALWQRRFGGDRGLLGSLVRLNGEAYQVVGIMPPGFRWGRGHGREAQGDVWAPFALTPERVSEASRGLEFLGVYARLGPGLTLADGQQDIEGILTTLRARFPRHYGETTGWRVTAVPVQEDIMGPLRPGLVLVFAAVASLLLVAACNVAGLLLAREAGRRRDASVRAALGASRWRLARETLAEAGVLAGLGGAAGLFLAWLAVNTLEHIDRATLPRSAPFLIDLRVVAFALGATLLATLVSGVLPAWQASRTSLMGWLRAGDPAGGVQARRARRALVVVQTAVALALLVGAGLLVRSLAALHGVPVGFRTAEVLSARLQLPRSRYAEPPSRRQLLDRVLELSQGRAGISRAGAISDLPLGGTANSGTFAIEGQPELPPGQQPHGEIWSADPGYFDVLGIPCRRGRPFDERDVPEAEAVALVSESLVRRYFPGEDPIGRRIDFEGNARRRSWRTIVGVVGDVRDRGLDRAPKPQLYVPFAQRPSTGLFLVVRAPGEGREALPALRSAVREADPELALFAVATLARLADESTRERRVAGAALAAGAAAAVILAALGLYGLLAQNSRERTREIGVRMAIGARPADILWLILADGGRLVLAGVVAGLALGLAGSRLLRGLVFGVTVTDPVTYAMVGLLLGLVALVACSLPAWRASRADPVKALRAD